MDLFTPSGEDRETLAVLGSLDRPNLNDPINQLMTETDPFSER
jgi:hypothetical protein